MTNPPASPAPAPVKPAPDPPSLVQRITTLEDQITRILAMMARDREWMDDILARIGLPL